MIATECPTDAISNPFKYTGQWFDSEIGQYYLRARQYDPHLGRFTTYDPVPGRFAEPLTLHKYLYCQNDPVNRIDPGGRFAYPYCLISPILTGYALYSHGLEFAAYATTPDTWNFWGLADATFRFMPFGMAVSIIQPQTLSGNIAAFFTGWGIDELTHVTGMGIREGAAMNFWAYLFYASYLLHEQAEFYILPSDMADFARWHGHF